MTSGHESSEDYLEAILVIRRERGWCRNVDIAPSPPNPATLRCSVCRSERSRA